MKPTPCLPRGILPWLLSCAAMMGCGGTPTDLPGNLSALYGEVYTEELFVVVPGRRWDLGRDGGEWTFRSFASLWWYVRETPEAPVTLVLRPSASTIGSHCLPRWDGEDLAADPITLFEGEVEIEIPVALLVPGHHELRLLHRRPKDAARLEAGFDAIGLKSGGSSRWLAPEEMPTYRQLASFLEFGVSGHDQEKRSGFVFLEPRSLETVIYRQDPATLRVVGENLGEGGARFTLADGSRVAEHALAGPGRVSFRVPLSRGRHRLTFSVTAEGGGPFLWGAPVMAAARTRGTPIILLSLDTTRRDALSPYGASDEVTPAIDAFARQATVFDRAAATAPWTLPSHASMFTGLYPSRHGAGVSRDKLAASFATLAGILRDHGYYTAGFSGGPLTAHRFGLGQGFHQFRDPDRRGTLGDRMTSYAEEMLAEWGDQPFFLFLNYFDPHGPYEAPEDFKTAVHLDRYRLAVSDLKRWQPTIEGRAGNWWKLIGDERSVPDEVLAYLRATYLAEVAFMDAQIGRLLERLEEADLFDRSLILITADHGQLLGEAGVHGHGLRLDPELIDAPLIVKWPRQRRGGRVRDLVSIVDVFPTILEAAGLTPPPSDGRVLRPRDAPAGADRAYVLMEEHESLVHPMRGPMRIAPHLFGIQEQDFRQVWWHGGASCARHDEGGWIEVRCPEDAERRRTIELALEAPREVIPLGAEPLNEEDRKRLEALGYL